MRRTFGLFFLLFMISQSLLFADYESDCNNDGKTDQWTVIGGDGRSVVITTDRNYDGKVDMKIEYGPDGNPIYEEFDHNYDGNMDTFNFFQKGKQVRQEIDSNYDQKVDIWIYLIDGIYIERYERDTDFDGKVDKVKKYGA
jgi:hypothetical protein